MTRAVVDRIMRWRGRPPEKAGVREPRRPKPTLPAAAVALDEPRTRPRRLRWTSKNHQGQLRPGGRARGQGQLLIANAVLKAAVAFGVLPFDSLGMSSGRVTPPEFQKSSGPVTLALIHCAIWVTK